MKIKIIIAIMAINTLSVIHSCKKDEQQINCNSTQKKKIRSSSDEENIIIRDESSTGNVDLFTTAILGRKYNNPYNVTNIKNAWNLLSNHQIANLIPTHYYVKFAPSTLKEYQNLIEAKFPLTTIPLDYEIIEWGDLMPNASAFHNGIPEYYTLMPIEEQIPEVPFTIIDSLYLTRYEDIVTEKAFDLANESENYLYDRIEEPNKEFDVVLDNTPEPTKDVATNWRRGWGEKTTSVETGGTLPAEGTSAPYYEPLPGDVANSCGCALNSDTRKPSGCVVVAETQFAQIGHPWQGVNDVMVEFFGPFFQYATAQTYANGCFSSNRIIHHKLTKKNKLPVIGRVIFISSRKTIKGLRADNIISYAMPLGDDVGNLTATGKSLNNIHIQYNLSTSTNSLATLYYTACHANNSIYEMTKYAYLDGINAPPNGIHILMNKKTGAAATPMIRKLLLSGNPVSVITMGFFVNFLNFTPVVGTWGIQQVLATFPPDITFGYNWATQNQFNTDRMRTIFFYHELGHSIHYSKTSTSFWITLIVAEGTNGANPYGNSIGELHAPQIALCETWATHCGYCYSYRRYGPNLHSNLFAPYLMGNSNYALEEQERFSNAYIPSGILGDLYDDWQYNANALNPGISENLFVSDTVNGFTNKMFFDELGSSTHNIYNFIDNLKDYQLPNTGAQNTLIRYNTLTASYGL